MLLFISFVPLFPSIPFEGRRDSFFSCHEYLLLEILYQIHPKKSAAATSKVCLNEEKSQRQWPQWNKTCVSRSRVRTTAADIRAMAYSKPIFKRPRSPGCPLSLLDRYDSAIGRTPPTGSQHDERKPFTVPRTPTALGEGNRPTKRKIYSESLRGTLHSRCESCRRSLDSISRIAESSGERESPW